MRPAIAALILGTLGAVFPQTLIDWTKRAMLWPSFENADDLNPRDWYVTAVRVQSVFVALAGLAVILLERRKIDTSVPDDPDLTPSKE